MRAAPSGDDRFDSEVVSVVTPAAVEDRTEAAISNPAVAEHRPAPGYRPAAQPREPGPRR